MGMADTIPGVSGGTIAFISGIYEHLIQAISSVRFSHAMDGLRLLVFWKPELRERSFRGLAEIQWNFMIFLGMGIVAGGILVLQIMPILLDDYPFFTFAFFFGLIAFSVSIPFKLMEKRLFDFIILVLFAIVMFYLVGDRGELAGNAHPLAIFATGALAICAMILPGVSGAYIMVLLGQYRLIADSLSLSSPNFTIVIFFIAGVATGIFSFVRLLKYLLKNYHSGTMAALTGIMIGSLRAIWPVSYLETELTQNLILAGIGLALAGALVVYALEKVSILLQDPESPDHPSQIHRDN